MHYYYQNSTLETTMNLTSSLCRRLTGQGHVQNQLSQFSEQIHSIYKVNSQLNGEQLENSAINPKRTRQANFKKKDKIAFLYIALCNSTSVSHSFLLFNS